MSRWMRHSQVQNSDWHILENDDGRYSPESVSRAITLDIRDYLRRMTNVLECHNVAAIPRILRKIEKNVEPPRHRRRTQAQQHHRIMRGLRP